MGSNVVDYAAWQKGYMPPCEHVLIDQLAYRGARVMTSSDWGDHAYWIVTRDFRPPASLLLEINRILTDATIEVLKEKRSKSCIAATDY